MVAEGVQAFEQVTQLQKIRCDLAQGDYFSEPLTSEEAAEFLAAVQIALGDQARTR